MEFTFPLLAFFLILSCIFVKLISPYILQLRPKPAALRLPPGPWQLPVVGSLHHLLLSRFRDTTHLAITELSRNYGPLMFLRLGAVPTLVVSSAEAAREVMKTHDNLFCDRYPKATTNIVTSSGGLGIVFSPYNERWRESRKICVLELFSQRRVLSFRTIREEEVARLIHSISNESSGGLHINVTEKISRVISDTIVRAVIGEQCKQQDELIYYIKKSLELSVGLNLADLYPSSRLMRLLSTTIRDLVKYHRNITNIIKSIIYERGVVSSIKEGDDLDIFVAGTDTSSTTLEWAMSELMKNPRVLHKAQSEVRNTFMGKDKLEEEDITKLSYLPLVIKETLRLHPPVPVLIPRICREACQITGYDIPKGCMVMVNVWAIGRDNKYWDDPSMFKPERFENNNIDFKGTNFEYIPFGAGRRMCPGIMLGLANMELALASLLYHFDWELSGGIRPEDLDMTEASGITVKRKVNLMLHAKRYIPSKC
ncbi:hypothetical protein PR202_gb11856 [Eleusine coracana subsp. coracana]|uniref:Cytochrome P450 n=1 Tax=Eleusine coracana subsp. coracana TaxID=191504 RepID=A0AAV5EL87_ELECO|nr:hypothetical protein PR202_gb11856 [Eleusine coracana subsp. coracana]